MVRPYAACELQPARSGDGAVSSVVVLEVVVIKPGGCSSRNGLLLAQKKVSGTLRSAMRIIVTRTL